MGTVALWCSPTSALSQGGPTFGTLDAGGMPICLVLVDPGRVSDAQSLLSGTPYFVWAASKTTLGQEYVQASWRRFGPFEFTRGQRSIFRGGSNSLTNDGRQTATEASGRASLSFETAPRELMWFMVNPLPPGCGGPGETADGAERTLTVRTQLRPVAWPRGDALWFAPGTYSVDTFEGGVRIGLLDQPADLKVWNSNRTVGFGRGRMTFERTGGVKEGILADDTSLCVVNTAANNKLSLTFRGNTTVEFSYDGCVMSGTLAHEATLKSWSGDSQTYPPGTVVTFSGAGLITAVVLSPPAGAGSSLVGTWKRSDGPEVYTFDAEGGATGVNSSSRFSGRWSRAKAGTYTVTWSLRPPGQQANYIDTLTVAPDGRSFAGVNNFGNRVSAIRQSGGATVPTPTTPTNASIVGTWKRTDGEEVYTFDAEGGATGVNSSSRFSGRWSRAEAGKYTVTWSLRPPGQQANYIDTLTVASDGRSFAGVNNFGNRVSAIKR
jgi:hypothetical protein